jgi:hypothetical protein
MEVIFTEFWPFIAAVLIVGVIGDAVAKCIRAWRGTERDDDEE